MEIISRKMLKEIDISGIYPVFTEISSYALDFTDKEIENSRRIYNKIDSIKRKPKYKPSLCSYRIGK